ncbi:hypothetical protein HO133_005806 [Letharia lupina]|uniref:Uncharacterized protein n=1 Tax=Letharia lupina TaxID=560253 RepID=A0A8H6C7R5_9LECA|nr:uncharacterized protein HO133_005806 [Letharia lupina]KAF6218457.1 hypothetical protein HO133_005806 [Letharia lupina]
MRPKQTRKLVESQGAMENSQDNDGKGIKGQENQSAVMDVGVQIAENDFVRDEKGKEA